MPSKNQDRISFASIKNQLDYPDFLALMRSAWLIVSDSGGIQEEAPTLGKPLLVLRENTERPEAVQAGVARLAGDSLERMLEQTYAVNTWADSVSQRVNPFGDGRSAGRIVRLLANAFDRPETLLKAG